MAGRGTDIKLSEAVKAAGGLAIIGTERHDSRRVDRQLRGRAGRQGDPGSSQFFVSLEDSLMRKFGSDRIAKIMDRMGYKEGEVIQHSMITKSIERAQKKVEENAFGTRKRLFDYDDVMNAQRNAIYKKRKNALFGDRLSLDVSNMYYDVAEEIVNDHFSAKDFSSFELDLVQYLQIQSPISAEAFETANPGELIDLVFDSAMSRYEKKGALMADKVNQFMAQVNAKEDQQFKNVEFPVTDGQKGVRCVLNIDETNKVKGKNIIIQIEKVITLGNIDNEWKEHLRQMDDLRTAVQHASIEQKDPLVIYKKESYNLFTAMLTKVSKEVVGFLSKADLPNQAQTKQVQKSQFEAESGAFEKGSVAQKKVEEFEGSEGYQEAMQNAGNNGQRPAPKRQPITTAPKIGRNDKVDIKNLQTGETKSLKFKQAEPLLKTGVWRVVQQEA